jgi:hypothetical protein
METELSHPTHHNNSLNFGHCRGLVPGADETVEASKARDDRNIRILRTRDTQKNKFLSIYLERRTSMNKY